MLGEKKKSPSSTTTTTTTTNVRRNPVGFFTNSDHTTNFLVFREVLNDITGISAHMNYSFSSSYESSPNSKISK